MIDRENDDDPRVDRLVLEHLQRSAARVDSQTLVQRILAERLALPVSTSTSGEEPSPRPDASSGAKSDAGSDVKPRAAVSWRRTVSWWGTAALLMALAFLGGRYFDHHAAVAATALQGVQNHHAQSIDYYYRVRFDPDPRTWNPKNRLEGPSLSYLWTRGDRFWSDCEIGDIRLKLGREANGTIWVTGRPEEGIRFSNRFENLPPTIAQICQINSMSVPRLVNEVLVDFDLSSCVSLDATGRKRTLVWAQLKPNRTHVLLSSALLEIDTSTNVLVRLVLWTVEDGRPKGTVAFTLLESNTIEDSQYELESHLAPGAKIETQTLPSPDYQPEFQAPGKAS